MLKVQITLVTHLAVLCLASPTLNASTADEGITTTSPVPTGEDVILVRAIERTVNEALARTINEYLEPLQQSVENLTQTLGQISSNVDQLTTTALQAEERESNFEGSVQILTQSLWHLIRCGFGYEHSNVTGHCYKLHRERVRWSVANDTCRGEGALLAVINDREEARLLGDICSRNDYSCYINVYKNSAGRWVTFAGEKVGAVAGHRVWGGGEPKSEAEFRFGVLYDDGTVGSVIEDSNRPFICERAAV